MNSHDILIASVHATITMCCDNLYLISNKFVKQFHGVFYQL